MVRILLSLFLFTVSAHAEILFEGYSKVFINDEHKGFTVIRYEFDQKMQHFKSTYLLKLANVTESVKAVADESLKPISYEYTSASGNEQKIINAKFAGGKVNATVKTGKKIEKINKDLPPGTFISTFLVYVMLKSKDGLKSDTHYEYQAIAEEEAKVYKGKALVGKTEIFKGISSYKILNTFNQQKFLSYVNGKGEILGTESLDHGINVRTELVAEPKEAIASFLKNTTVLKILFGDIPKGENNTVFLNQKASKDQLVPSKTEGVPQGSGIMIKPGVENGN